MYIVSTDTFQGPLDRLLELIRKREMDISTVSLAAVTSDFLKYTPSDDERALFLDIASKLILIKSRELLPQMELTEEEEEGISQLENQLAVHKYIHELKVCLAEMWNNCPVMATRSFMMNREPLFMPPAGISARLLQKQAESFAEKMGAAKKQAETEKEKITIEKIINRLLERISESYRSIGNFWERGTRDEKIATFLAILHLFKQGAISVRQERVFGDIAIAKHDKQ